MLIDFMGTVHVPDPAARIVCLVPSLTEALCELGLAERLVGRTGFCVHPRAIVQDIPKMGGTKDVNVEKIRKVAPTHVIVNVEENRKATVAELAEFIPNVIVTHPLGPRDNLPLMRLFGGIFGAEAAAERWCQSFEEAYARLQAMPKAPPQRLLYCIWKDPWMSISADTYIARMMAEIGWTIPTLPDPARYPAFEWNEALLESIDGVLLSTEPFRFKQEHVDALERQIGKPVTLVDGEMMSWYGSRSLQGLQYLQELATK